MTLKIKIRQGEYLIQKEEKSYTAQRGQDGRWNLYDTKTYDWCGEASTLKKLYFAVKHNL